MSGLIYIVDDQESILEILDYNLRNSGYDTRVFKNGSSFLNYFNDRKPDLVILDLMLPDMDGYDICKKIKEKTAVPVLILSARSEEFDKVLGLELGADDYMVKPFGVRELVARVKNILKRTVNGAQWFTAKPLKSEYDFGGTKLGVDEEKHEILLGGRPVGLNPKEFKVMTVLLRNIDSLVPRMELIRSVWGEDYFGDTRTLDVHIRRIRKKMSYGDFGKKFLKTVHGLGYKLVSGI